jgi:hypothetical protein
MKRLKLLLQAYSNRNDKLIHRIEIEADSTTELYSRLLIQSTMLEEAIRLDNHFEQVKDDDIPF